MSSIHPPGKPPGVLPGMSPGGNLSLALQIIEPSGIEPSVRSRRPGFARRGHGRRAEKRPKTVRSGQTPHSQSQRAGVRSPDRCLVIDPDCQPCALASVPYGFVIQGTLVARVASSSGRSALRSARVPPNPLRCAESALRGAAHKPRYRVGSRRLRRRHVRAAGFSWTSPAALLWKRLRRCYFRSLVCCVGFLNPGCSPSWFLNLPWL